jgi:hypothetical protein
MIIPALLLHLDSCFGQSDGQAGGSAKSEPSSKKEITFTVLTMFDGVLDDGKGSPLVVMRGNKKEYVTFHGYAYKASDGEVARVFGADLITMEFAREYLETKLKRAEIIERGPKLGNKEKSGGERIVAQPSSPSSLCKGHQSTPPKKETIIIYIDGTSYVETSSCSLADALALEKYIEAVRTAGKPPKI